VIIAGAALWLIWIVWRPVYFIMGENVVQVGGKAELATLAPETEFLLQGKVEPVVRSEHEWQGRFTFVHRERKDFAGGPSKDQRVVDVENWRPALRFNWAGGALVLPENGYSLTYAPQVERRFWPRKWLGTKRVDDWHQTSTGFRAGEAAMAYGQVTAEGQLQVVELMQWPLKSVVDRIGHENRLRRWLTIAFKCALTFFCLVYALPRSRTPVST
jgi:hypothetical protein